MCLYYWWAELEPDRTDAARAFADIVVRGDRRAHNRLMVLPDGTGAMWSAGGADRLELIECDCDTCIAAPTPTQ